MRFNFTDFFIKHTENGSFSGNPAARMSSYFCQDGRCYVTGKILRPYHRELHHRLPVSLGGTDDIENLILLDRSIHKLIHAKHSDEIGYYLSHIHPTDEQLFLINQLRLEAKQRAIDRS